MDFVSSDAIISSLIYTLLMSRFTHLHTHSHYSLLSALPHIDELVNAAVKNGMTALALTDNGNLYGAIEFYKTCKKKNIKPIIGVDFYVAQRSRHDKEAGIDNRRTRLVLLAQNEIGYKNLLKLVTISHLEGFYYKPRIDREILEIHNEGLIAIVPSFSGDISVALKSRTQDKAKEYAAFYKKIFGTSEGATGNSNGRLFIEITRHPEIEGHEANMKALVQFAKEEQIPVLAAHDVYYMKPEDRQARDTLVLVNSHSDASDRVSDDEEDDFSFISPEKAEDLFKDIPEALLNTTKVADMCNLELTLGKWVFPNYTLENGTHDDELRKLTMQGFERRKIAQNPDLIKRVDYELEIIKKKGYAPYFLVVADLLRHAHEESILTTTRGSAAGSLVSYLAGITNVDPILLTLPFERFLNPERPSAPDIDMDIADNRRDEMIEYARKKYGRENVAQIGTFGTMMARGSVRDASRAMGFTFEIGDRISKMIPMGSQGFPMTIKHALSIVPELKKIYEDEEDTKRIIDMAKKIEGCARHISVHAAGVVIAPRPLVEFTPLQFDPKGEGKIITQYDMHAIEDAGLLKFDFLGIRNLSILADAVERVQKIENIKIDIENVPINDQKTFDMLAKGETIGLFQLNGSGMTRFLVDLKPSTIHDINAMVALYRPGPMESIPEYIERKHDTSKVKYLDPRMKDILDRSYGVITYQDDVMMIAIKLAGYSWLDADKLRKAMGKKIPAEMAGEKDKLLKGFIANGMSEKKAAGLWKLIEPFAAYGFNKAHAASYGKVAYQTAYMKANYPEIYMSAVLTAESGNIDMIAEIVTECKRMGVPVLPPDVNESFSQFTVIKSEDAASTFRYRIRFGLVTIKNFGQGVSTAIIEERKRAGKFKSLADFLDRVKDRNLNKKSLEALIKSGAMDCFGEDRGVMLANIDRILEYNKERGAHDSSQDSLFGLMADHTSVPTLRLEPKAKAEIKEKLAWEKELLGLYISGHPLDKYREILIKKDIDIKKALENKKEGETVILGVIVTEVRAVQTKNNETMAFLTVSDFSGTADAVVFPRTYREFRELITPDKCLAIKATVNARNGEKGLAIEGMKEL
jgi:DNA polymerase-3 subunit alpha